MSVSTTHEPLISALDPTIEEYVTLARGIAHTSCTIEASMSNPLVDKFYNVAQKVPHPNTIVPKKESRRLVNRELQKRKRLRREQRLHGSFKGCKRKRLHWH